MAKYEIYFDHSVKDFNTFKIGGKAKYIVIIYDIDTLYKVCNDCILHNIKYKVIGLGANLLFDDDGYNGAIIVNKCRHIIVDGDSIIANSGTPMCDIINTAYLHSLSGLEHLIGIPATLGGAIVNNLGSNGEICDIVEHVECFIHNNPSHHQTLLSEQCNFGYRNSVFRSGNYVITSVKLRLRHDDMINIRDRMSYHLNHKITSQPIEQYSAGSVFKRSTLIPSKIIDELGLKGYSIGDAQISTKHAGFIINKGNASTKDVKLLIGHIKAAVKAKYNIELSTEIEFISDKF